MGGKRLSFMVAGLAVVAFTAVFYCSPEYSRTMSYFASSNLTEKINVAKMRLSEFHNTALAPYLFRMNAHVLQFSNIMKDKVSSFNASAWVQNLAADSEKIHFITMKDKLSSFRTTAWVQNLAAVSEKALASGEIHLSTFWHRCISATYVEKIIAVAAAFIGLVCILVLRRPKVRKVSTEPLVAGIPAEMVQPESVPIMPDPKILAERAATLRHRTNSPAPINRAHGETAPAFANANQFLTHLNQVSDQDMKLIPGLGEKSAQKLTKYRSRVGAFTKWDDLRTAGVHPVVLANLQKGNWHTVTY